MSEQKEIKLRGPQPKRWKHADPEIHKKYRPYLMNKEQAKFRKEDYQLSFEDYCQIWSNDWANRGRKMGQMYLTRKDASKAWNLDNCVLAVIGK